MPTKNVQMNSDEELLKEFREKFGLSFEIRQIPLSESIESFFISALSRKEQSVREEVGREIVEALHHKKYLTHEINAGKHNANDCPLCWYNKGVEKSIETVSQITGLNEK